MGASRAVAAVPMGRGGVEIRLTISRKFFAVFAVLAPLILAVAFAGAAGLASMKSEFARVSSANQVSQVSTSLGDGLSRAEVIALRIAVTMDPAQRRALNATLDQTVVPTVEERLAQLRTLHAHGPASERTNVAKLAQGWARFVALRDTGVLGAQGGVIGGSGVTSRLASEIDGIFGPLRAITENEAALEATDAGNAHAHAVRTYNTDRLIIWGIAFAAFVLGIGSMLALTRNVVPRIRRFSQFASAVAGGDLGARLVPTGSDELAILGRALDEIVERRAVGVRHDQVQSEFVDTLQVTDSEEVAHDLLKRQLERSVAGSSVVVLNRNNSADRLEATTELPTQSVLHESLIDAKPRSCLAILFARTHTEDPDHEPLTRCAVCGNTRRMTTCEPLLVGGEVIGSVLIEHDQAMQEQQTASLRESVSQAAPVLANLRNLALAEFRAATDGLTGLPNKRAAKDTVKRMSAHASRTLTPLSAIVLDLDHFKQINDTFGHGRGDDVLAAVGAVLATTVRASDFVGRNGGEEFIVLLPDTDAKNAALVAEKIRAAIAQITIPGIERPITASLGIAAIPQHAGDGDDLIRSADRALYTAKTDGRNRTATAIATTMPHAELTPAGA
jgi:diguanylate cyclase (GGDEF)-like protein